MSKTAIPLLKPSTTKIHPYSNIANILHWVTAIAIFLMIISGFMIRFEIIANKSFEFTLYQWHKSLGVCTLIAMVFRLIYRLISKPPSLPTLPYQEQVAAKVGHIALYTIIITVLISGWIVISSSTTGIPTLVFGYFNWPHLPISRNQELYSVSKIIHFYSVLALTIFIIGHITMAALHQRQNVAMLERMPLNRASGLASLLLIIVFTSYATTSIYIQKKNIISSTNSNKHIDTIEFRGIQSGKPFVGTFTEWRLETNLNTQSNDQKTLKLTIHTGSATTNNDYYDSTLQEPDWFYVENHPTAIFTSSKIIRLTLDTYDVKGNLTIKNITQPIEFKLRVSGQSLQTSFVLSRLGFEIGKESDPNASWVSDDIHISVNIKH